MKAIHLVLDTSAVLAYARGSEHVLTAEPALYAGLGDDPPIVTIEAS